MPLSPTGGCLGPRLHHGLKQAGEWRQGEAHGLPPARGLQGRWTLLEEPLNSSGGVHLDRLRGLFVGHVPAALAGLHGATHGWETHTVTSTPCGPLNVGTQALGWWWAPLSDPVPRLSSEGRLGRTLTRPSPGLERGAGTWCCPLLGTPRIPSSNSSSWRPGGMQGAVQTHRPPCGLSDHLPSLHPQVLVGFVLYFSYYGTTYIT